MSFNLVEINPETGEKILKKAAGSSTIIDSAVSTESTWSSKKVSDSLVDIDADNVNITKEDDTKKSLQAMYEDGELGGGGVDYSTEEVNTGVKWIDGKPIYRKVAYIPKASNGTVYSGISNIDKIISCLGTIKIGGSKRMYPFVQSGGGNACAINSYDENSIVFMSAWEATDLYLVFEYTKTTD